MKHLFSLLRGWQMAALILLLLAGRTALAQAPAWETAIAIGPAAGSSVYTTATATDATGKVYITGEFSGTVSWGSTTFTSTVGRDIFVAKWDPVAAAFVWARVGGTGGDDFATSIAVSGASIYVAGYLGGAATFGPVAFTTTGQTDAFVVKLTDAGSTGQFVWGKSAGGLGNSNYGQARGLATNGSSVYLAGNFVGTVGFGTTALTSAGSSDVFVAKLTDAGSTGSFVWAQRAGGLAPEYTYALAATATGVYVAGSFGYIAGFGGDNLTASGTDDVFVAKLTDAGATGSFTWAQRGGGPGTEAAYALAVTGNNVYVAGSFTSPTATFGSTVLANAGAYDVFVAKILDAGATASTVWAQQAGGPGDDYANALIATGNSVYVAGDFRNTARFGSTALPAIGDGDVFAAKLVDAGPAGAFAWAAQAGAPGKNTYAYALAQSGPHVYAVGYFEDVATFGPRAVTGSPNATNAFLASLTDATGLASARMAPLAGVAVFPSPAHGTATVLLPALPSSTATLTILDALGRPLRTQTAATNSKANLDLTGLAPGLYAVRVAAGGSTATQRLVVE